MTASFHPMGSSPAFSIEVLCLQKFIYFINFYYESDCPHKIG